ncbi:hypothetical protein KMT30_36015 [Streptomyces sp. IBSBF 2953]|nr:hypothetical protein [Streptomyces hayashii]
MRLARAAQTAGLFGVRRQARVGPAGVELGGIGDRVRFEEPVGAVPMLGSVQLRLPAVDEHPVPHVGPLGASPCCAASCKAARNRL